mmetsp:Transcript_23431/g.48773  ORF Transcript_23431/g.48773 Transcript_23431/m.48773 type:complete len:241 (+) Transcript_23431:752-1474(+)
MVAPIPPLTLLSSTSSRPSAIPSSSPASAYFVARGSFAWKEFTMNCLYAAVAFSSDMALTDWAVMGKLYLYDGTDFVTSSSTSTSTSSSSSTSSSTSMFCMIPVSMGFWTIFLTIFLTICFSVFFTICFSITSSVPFSSLVAMLLPFKNSINARASSWNCSSGDFAAKFPASSFLSSGFVSIVFTNSAHMGANLSAKADILMLCAVSSVRRRRPFKSSSPLMYISEIIPVSPIDSTTAVL